MTGGQFRTTTGGVLGDVKLLGQQAPPGSVVDLQFIGHSRGADVIAEAFQDLASLTTPTFQDIYNKYLKGSYHDMTMLDPHPANSSDQLLSSMATSPLAAVLNTYLPFWAIAAPVLVGYESFVKAADDPQIIIPTDVNQAEIYYQNSSWYDFSAFSQGFYLNLWGEGVADMNNQAGITVPAYNLSQDQIDGSPIGHGEVPLWYLNNLNTALIDPQPAETPFDNLLSSPPSSASLWTYLYPQYVNDQTVAQRLADEFAAGSSDVYQGNLAAAANDFQAFEDDVNAADGTAIAPADAQNFTSLTDVVLQELFALTTPTVTVNDLGGPYTTASYPAQVTVTGIGGNPVAGDVTVTYYLGDSVSDTPLDGPPSASGIYTVVASFISSDPNYSNAKAVR